MDLFNNKKIAKLSEELKETQSKLEHRGVIDLMNLPVWKTIQFTQNSDYTNSKSLQISTLNRCVNLIGDSVASTPLYPYIYKENWKYIDESSTLYNILNVQPNKFMGAYTFKKLMINSMLLDGAGMARIYRNNNYSVKSLVLIDYKDYETKVINDELIYVNKKTNEVLSSDDVICVLNYTSDGVTGISTITHAVTALDIAYNSDQHADNFFKGGGAMAGILSPKAGSMIGSTQAQQAKTAFANANNVKTSYSTNNIVVMEGALEYQAIGVNPVDAQLLETRKFSVEEICRFFNVPPSLAFSENGKFSTAEAQQNDFLQTCLNPLFVKIENEFFRKLYLPSEWINNELRFDDESLLRLDAVTKADYLTKLHAVGGFTSNEIRERLNAKNPVKGGNRAFTRMDLQPTDALVSEQSNVNPDATIDNKLKNNDDNNGK